MKPIDEMTPDEIRLEIAKKRGYVAEQTEVTDRKIMFAIFHKDNDDQITNFYYNEDSAWQEAFNRNNPPNWPADIAAAWELEGEIPEDEHEIYARILNGIVNRWYDSALERGENVEHQRYYLIHAAPLQRCKAWLAWKRGLE